jgi:hypothetical protein
MHDRTKGTPKDPGQNKRRTRAPQHRRQLCCSSVGYNCSRQLFGTSAIPGGRILKGILSPRALLAQRCATLVVAYFISTAVLQGISKGDIYALSKRRATPLARVQRRPDRKNGQFDPAPKPTIYLWIAGPSQLAA